MLEPAVLQGIRTMYDSLFRSHVLAYVVCGRGRIKPHAKQQVRTGSGC